MPSRSELAKIHIAKKELSLTDPLYRDLLFILFGKKSARDLDAQEVEELLTHFLSLGWRPIYTGGQVMAPGAKRSRRPGKKPLTGAGLGAKNAPGGLRKNGPKNRRDFPSRPGKKYDELGRRPGMASPAQLRLIEFFWMTGKGVRQKTPEALSHFLKHFFHVSDIRSIRAAQVTRILGAIRHVASESR